MAVAIVAGEVLRLGALCRSLGLRDATPAAAVLAAWQHRPDDFMACLDGVFAFALYTGEELLLYRDPSGLQPLYWADAGLGAIAFATRLAAIASNADGSPRGAARPSLQEYLRFLDVAAPNTWYRGVYALQPGLLLRCSADSIPSIRRVQERPVQPPATGLAAAADALDHRLSRSVGRRLAGAARPAAFLSGGVDSALLCAMARRHRPDTVALTVAFDSAEYDESPQAARIAAHLGLAHRVLRFERSDYLRAFDVLCRTLDQPMADPATMATVLAFEHCRRERFDVILDGTGADEAVGAEPARHVRLAVQYASLLPRAMRAGLARALRALPPLAPYSPIADFEHPADTMIRWRGFTRPEIEALCGEPVSFAHTTFYRTFARYPRHAHLERYTALLNAMPCDRLSQAAAATGAHLRYPYFDRGAFEFLSRLPPEIRTRPGEPKRILRAALSRHVPRSLWDQPKRGFNFPLTEFLAADDFALVRQHLLDSDVWQRTGLLAATQVERYARRLIAGERQLTFRIWTLVVLGGWLAARDKVRSQ